jgi:hypothetical protein
MELIIAIDDADVLRDIAIDLITAADELQTVRFAIDDGGLKYAVGRWTWTPPIGQVTP